MADRVAIMHAGRVEQIGAAPEVWRRPATEFVARFLGWNVTGLLGGRVAIRPDGLVPDPAGTLAGVVTARTFRRDHFLLRVQVGPSGTPLEVPLEVAVRADDVAPVGAAIRLAVDPAAVVHLPPSAPGQRP